MMRTWIFSIDEVLNLPLVDVAAVAIQFKVVVDGVNPSGGIIILNC
jgi:hypothetical protein